MKTEIDLPEFTGYKFDGWRNLYRGEYWLSHDGILEKYLGHGGDDDNYLVYIKTESQYKEIKIPEKMIFLHNNGDVYNEIIDTLHQMKERILILESKSI